MAQVIILEPNETLRDLLAINLKSHLGCEVIPRETAEEAVQLLSILPSVDLIITRTKLDSEPTAKILGEHIRTEDLDTHLVIIGEVPVGMEEFSVSVANAKDWERVINHSAKILGISLESVHKKVKPDYIPIPVEYFYSLTSVCCDVYIRIKKGPNEFQYVKRIHQGDAFGRSTIMRYIDQGLKNFYIPKEYEKNFTNFISDQLVARLEDKNADWDEKFEVIADSYGIALKEVVKLGFNSATVQLTEGIINGMLDSFKVSPQMNTLLHKILNSKNGFLYQHAHMTSIVTSECLVNLGHDEPLMHRKMAYAAFFQHIPFVDNEELAKITTYEALESSSLSEEDWDLVFHHALEASEMVKKFPEAPKGVDLIIKHHHGAANGKGFSVTGQLKIEGLSKVFIIGSEFAKELLIYKEKGGRPRPIVDELYGKYQDKEMIRVIKALEKTLRAQKK